MSGENTKGLLAGGGAAALYWWGRNEDDRTARIRALRADQRDLKERLNELLSTGDWIRLQLPVVRDAITGIASASAGAAVPSPIPNPVSQSRPDVSQGNNVPNMQWPPLAPQYDPNGNTNQVGEMAMAFRTLTYQEPRAFLQGLCLDDVPSAEGLFQIFAAAQGLSAAASSLSLTVAQYKAAWLALFSGLDPTPEIGANHEDPSRRPSATPSIAGLAIVPLTNVGGSIPGYPYANRNTDAVQRYRITVPPAGVGAGLTVATVQFGAEYRYRDPNGTSQAFQPAIPMVMSNLGALFGASAITPTGFNLVAQSSLASGTTHDVSLTIIAGVPAL